MECSRTSLSEAHKAKIRGYLESELDWEDVLHTASMNGLLPIVSSTLLNNFSAELPEEIRVLLESYFFEHARNNIFQTNKLLQAIEILANGGVPTVPIKGAMLAHSAYQNLSLRDYVDHDILVKPKHFEKAARILVENGFKPNASIDRARKWAVGLSAKKDIGMTSLDGRVRVELHWKLSGAHFGLPYEITDMWDRVEAIDIGGTSVKTLSFKDLFVYLCLHGSRHGWAKLSWICDLRELAEKHETFEGPVDWVAIRDHAKKYGCEKVVEFSIFLLSKFFGFRPDFPDFDRIENDPNYDRISKEIWERTIVKNNSHTEISDQYRYHLALRERKTDRIKLHIHYIFWYLKLALTPNSLDRAIFRLPNVLSPLYVVLRPIRLFVGMFQSESDAKNRMETLENDVK